MKRASKSPFLRLLALGLNLQLMVSPLAQAMDNDTVRNIANTAKTLTGAYTGMVQQMAQQKQAAQMAQGLQGYMAQQVPPDQVAVPVFAGCPVFMAQTNRPATGQRCEANSFDPNMLGYYSALTDIATSNIETYGVYEIKGNAKSSPGVRCLEDAEKNFSALLESRLTEIDKLTEKLNADLMVFEKANEALVNQIKKGNALLFGTPAELLKDVKFEDKFKDKACASMIDSTAVKAAASKGGYEALKNEIQSIVDKPNKSEYTAKSFTAQAGNIRQDIINVANQLADKASKMEASTLVGNPAILTDSIKSKYNLKNFPGFNEALGRKMAKLQEKQANVQTQILANLSKEEQGLFGKNLLDPKVDTGSIIRNYKNVSDTSCVQTVFEKRFGGVDKFTDLLRDPSVSEKMGREADNKLKNTLPGILSDSTLSLQEKLSQISSNSAVRKTRFKVQKTENINGVALNANSYIQVDDIFKRIIMEDCKRLANTNNDQGESPANIIKNIEKFHNDLSRSFQTFPSELKADIQDELISCTSDSTAGAAGTCSPDSFSTTSNSFCLKTASTCASNMLACADKAKAIYDTTRKEQLKLATTYKANVDALKIGLMADYMGHSTQGGTSYNKRARQVVTLGPTQISPGIKGILEQKARQLDALFPGQVYGVVTDEDLALTTDKMSLIPGIDPSLQIEDPKEYINQMKANLAKIKKKVSDQNKAIAENIQKEKASIIAAAKAEKQFWSDMAANCQGLIAQYNQNENQRVTETNKAMEEQNRQRQEFCAEARKMSSCPTEGEVSSLNSTMGQIAAQLQPGDFTAYNNYKKMSQLCYSSGDDGGNRFIASTNEGSEPFLGADKVCQGELKSYGECIQFNKANAEYLSFTDTQLDKLNDEKKKCEGKDSQAEEDCIERVEGKIEKFDKSKKTALAEKEKSEGDVAKLFREYQGSKLAQEIGQQSFPSCNSMASGEVGKTAGDAMRDIAGAVIENKNATQQ